MGPERHGLMECALWRPFLVFGAGRPTNSRTVRSPRQLSGAVPRSTSWLGRGRQAKVVVGVPIASMKRKKAVVGLHQPHPGRIRLVT